MLPDINIVVALFFPPDASGELRRAGFCESVASWSENLRYEGHLGLVVVNDGPRLDLEDAALEWGRGSLTSLGHEHAGYGVSLNQGFQEAFTRSSLAANFDDDWSLTERLDLTPWARLLLEREELGSVKLMAPFPGISGTVQPLAGSWVMVIDRHNLVAGLRAALYHRRFHETYGGYDPRLNARETERLFNERFCKARIGPDVALALWFPWEEGRGAVVEMGRVNP